MRETGRGGELGTGGKSLKVGECNGDLRQQPIVSELPTIQE